MSKKLTESQYNCLINLFGKIIQRADRSCAKKMINMMMDLETAMIDVEEDNGMTLCDCPDCESKSHDSHDEIFWPMILDSYERLMKDITNIYGNKIGTPSSGAKDDDLYRKLKWDLERKKDRDADTDDLK